MNERNDRGVVIGGGPFQPPSKTELELLRSERDDLVREVAALKYRNEQQHIRITRQNAQLDVTDLSGLDDLLVAVLERTADEVSVDAQKTADGLTITVEGVTADDDAELVPVERDFEVSTTVSFEHRAQVRAADRDTAHDLYAEALRDSLHEVEITITHDAVDDQDSYEAEFDYINVNEL